MSKSLLKINVFFMVKKFIKYMKEHPVGAIFITLAILFYIMLAIKIILFIITGSDVL